MGESDESIYSRFLAEHKEEDFRLLLERHREGLFLFLYGYVHNEEDAEELMLDAYAEAACGRASFSGKSAFKTWLFAIGKKKALAFLRKSRRFSVLPAETADETAPPPELDLLRDERDRQLYRALAGLKDEYRQVLTLLYFEEMTYDEAAQVMGKTKRQLYHLAERGRASLKDELERMGFDYAQYG